jgi:hypothetical protein
MELNIKMKADILKNSCKATISNYDSHDCKSIVNSFCIKAGWPGRVLKGVAGRPFSAYLSSIIIKVR